MRTFKLIHDRPNCIGCGACAVVAPDFWTMCDDGKSDIINAPHKPDGTQERQIMEKDFEINLEAAESCPVEVIHLVDEANGKKII